MPYVAGPFSSAHLYLQWGGDLPGGEEWSCGVRFFKATPGDPPDADAVSMLSGATAALRSFHLSALTFIHESAKMTYAKLNVIDESGHYAFPTTNEEVITPAGGASAGSAPPNQIALAISLTTSVTRGPAHRGRFYAPMPAIGALTDGLMNTSVRDSIVGSATTLLGALNGLNAAYDVAVFSRKAGSPDQRVVTGIQVGRVLDTQRRRRNKLRESY